MTPVRTAPWLMGARGLLVPALVVLLASPTSAGDPGPSGSGRKAVAVPKRPRDRAPETLGHIVRPGDSVWMIARRHGVSVTALNQANRLTPGQTLRVGQVLRIPGSGSPANSQEPPSPAEIVLEAPPATGDPGITWPVAGPVGSAFGPRGGSWHGGIDISAKRGAPIRAAASGMIIASGWESGYGRVIKIWHRFDFMTVYAHNHENLGRVGDWVERGDVIATVGSSGRTTAPHLHFEVRLGGKKYNPRFWLPESGAVEVASSEPRPARVLR